MLEIYNNVSFRYAPVGAAPYPTGGMPYPQAAPQQSPYPPQQGYPPQGYQAPYPSGPAGIYLQYSFVYTLNQILIISLFQLVDVNMNPPTYNEVVAPGGNFQKQAPYNPNYTG